jgi:hypothetical protein
VTDTNLSRALLCCRNCFRAAIEGQEPCIRPLLDGGKIGVIRFTPLGCEIEELFSLRCARWSIALHRFYAGFAPSGRSRYGLPSLYSAHNCQSQVIRASTLLKSTVSNLPVVDSRAQEMSRKNLPSSTFPAKNCLPILQKPAQSFQGDHHRAPVGGFRPSHGRSFIQTGKREPLIASDGLLPSPACKLGMAANGGTAASTSATSVSQRGACTEGIELQSTSCEHPGR